MQLRNVQERPESSYMGGIPTGRMPYRRVRAVLCRWDADNTHAEESANALQAVFEDYGYACKRVILPADTPNVNPHLYLQDVMNDLGRAGESGDLTIFYYAGHGDWDHQNQQLQLQSMPLGYPPQSGTSAAQPKVGRADFTIQARATLDYSRAAVLYLLDTCHGSAAGLNGHREIFAASSIELPTDKEWTFELCRHLRNVNRKPITVAQLHGMMIKSFAEGTLAVTPVHSELTESMEGSIILAPVTGPIQPYRAGDPEDPRHTPMVLIAAQLEDMTSPPSVDDFKRWLVTNRPAMIHSVRIDVSGFHTSFSGVLLLTVPVSVWICLRSDPAYSFVRFVTSPNLVGETPVLASAAE